MKKVLIFYSKTGGGHLRAAEALAEEISLRKNYQVLLYDGLEKTSWGGKTKPDFLFYLLSHHFLPVYNFFYTLTDNTTGLAILRSTIKLIWGRQFKKIIEAEKPDLIVTTHHFISPSTIPQSNHTPFYIVVVDLGTPHRIWFDEKADLITTPSDDMARWATKKFSIPEEKIKVAGFPLKNHFKSLEKTRLSNSILILGAGMKIKQVKSWVEKIRTYFPDKKITIICGHNIRLLPALQNTDGVEAFGFVNNLHDFLNEADLVITKAGPGIIMEAAYLKKPLIITSAQGKQEEGNIRFVTDNNLGVFDHLGKNITDSISEIYKNYKKYSGNNIVGFDTDRIADYILRML